MTRSPFPWLTVRDASSRGRRTAAALVATLALSIVGGVALADVPGRVGRVAYIEGDVQAYSESDPEWKVAYVNQPITSHNSLFVGDTGRAEVAVGSTTLAMDAGSQVDIQQLDDNTFDATVVRGRVSMRVRRLDPGDTYSVAAEGADFALLTPGRYRIDAVGDAGGIAVFAGQASLRDEQRNVVVNAGNALRVVGDPAQPRIESGASAPTALDDWVLARENRFRNTASERYVSPNMTGYEELDANGRWATEADLGPVWYPTTHVQSDWAPYRYGRWAYVAPWGYTWVDDAPWGFAPFHYGRWVQVGTRWGWCPGAYVARPVYAPALVGFYGGSNFNASFAVGAGPAVGWYPLAPWERYSPHYTQSATYVTRVNNIVVVDAPPRFRGPGGGRDWNRERGGTLAPRDAFASQRSISRIAIAAPRAMFDRAAPVRPEELPRPALIPGAVRRGPDSGGRPNFRFRDDGGRRFGGDAPSAIDRSGRPNAAVTNAPRGDFNGGPPERRDFDRDRQPDARRFDRPQAPAAIQPVPAERSYPSRDGGRPRFDREAQAPQPAAPPIIQGPGEGGAGASLPPPQRYTPRMQAPMRSDDGSGRLDTPQSFPRPGIERPAGAPGFERPNREMRNMQQPPPGMERQRVERQAPAMIVPPAPQPQMPAPQAPAPRAAPIAPPAAPQAPVPHPAPAAQPAPAAPQPGRPRVMSPGEAAAERGQIGRDR